MVHSVDRMSRSEAGAALLSSEGEGIAVTNRMEERCPPNREKVLQSVPTVVAGWGVRQDAILVHKIILAAGYRAEGWGGEGTAGSL